MRAASAASEQNQLQRFYTQGFISEMAPHWREFVSGGGASIYGDFLFGEMKNRFGQTFVSTLGGPTVGTVDDLADMWGQFKSGDDFAAQSLRVAINNTPFLNMFYSRIALDYLFLYQVQEALKSRLAQTHGAARAERERADVPGQAFGGGEMKRSHARRHPITKGEFRLAYRTKENLLVVRVMGAIMKNGFLTLVVAGSTKAMHWFAACFTWLKLISEGSGPVILKLVALLLSFPFFKLSNLFSSSPIRLSNTD